MTRLASILGVATVATLVLLSGCEQATQKKDTDYAAALAGTLDIHREHDGHARGAVSSCE